MYGTATPQRRNTYVKTLPVQTALDIEAARKYCNQDFVTDDEKILACIRAAQYQAEVILRRSLTTRTLVLQMNNFPCWSTLIALDSGPAIAVTEIRYQDANDDAQIMDEDLYTLDNKSIPDVVCLEPNQSWPSTFARRNAVEIEYTAGHSDLSTIPEPIITAVKYLTKHFYDNPDMVVIGGGQVVEIPKTAEWLLWPHRDYRW